MNEEHQIQICKSVQNLGGFPTGLGLRRKQDILMESGSGMID